MRASEYTVHQRTWRLYAARFEPTDVQEGDNGE